MSCLLKPLAGVSTCIHLRSATLDVRIILSITGGASRILCAIPDASVHFFSSLISINTKQASWLQKTLIQPTVDWFQFVQTSHSWLNSRSMPLFLYSVNMSVLHPQSYCFFFSQFRVQSCILLFNIMPFMIVLKSEQNCSRIQPHKSCVCCRPPLCSYIALTHLFSPSAPLCDSCRD